MKKAFTAVVMLLAFCAASFADQVVLKDDQKFEAEVKSFDSYFVIVVLPNKREVSIPWNEVRQIKHTTTASSWLEETYMNNDDVEVATLVAPLSEGDALQKAIFPGFIMHGSGHFYAKKPNTGFSLLSAEILSLVMMGISVNELVTPVEKDQSFNVSRIVFYSGLTMFVGSWLWDVVFSAPAVTEYNSSNTFLINEPAPKEGENAAEAKTATAAGKDEKPKADAAGNTPAAKEEIKK